MADDIVEKYRRKLSTKITKFKSAPSYTSYSRAYKQFRKTQISNEQSFYEKFCNKAEKLIATKVTDKEREKLKGYIDVAHINISPEAVYSGTYLATILVLVLMLSLFMVVFNLFVLITGFVSIFLVFFMMPKVPKFIYNKWQAKASDQLLLAVLYLVIYMEREPNIEKAIQFVAEHLPPPISLDFMKILWDFESKTFSTVTESLDNYVTVWKDKNAYFVDSIHLIESSLFEKSGSKVRSLLSKATEVILNGTQDNMLHFAHSLQTPIKTLHMLGIVLPVLGLVMLPMVVAFMGATIQPAYIIVLYNVVLPIIVFIFARNILAIRPGGASSGSNIHTFFESKEKPKAYLFGKEFNISPIALSSLVFFGFFAPVLFVVIRSLSLGSEFISDFIYSDVAFYVSLLVVLGIGLSVSLYYRLKTNHIINFKRRTENIEKQFGSAIFQLGSRLEENIPAELAFAKVAESTKGTEVSDFFSLIDYNLREQGMSIKNAVFDKKKGAIVSFPSPMIKSVMSLMIEGVRKSPKVAADSMLTISRYLSGVNRVTERLKDLLADTIAEMQMQAGFFAPIIAGIVVSLAVLVTKVLLSLGQQLSVIAETGTGAETTAAAGLGTLSFFQISSSIPPYIFQLMVGIYVVQIVFILSYLLSGVVNGEDEVESGWLISGNLLKGTLLYVVVSFIASVMFSGIATSIAMV